MRRGPVALFVTLCLVSLAQAQLVVDNTMTPEQLVQNVLLGGGVTISNVTFNGAAATTVQAQSASFTTLGASNLGLSTGVILSTGNAATDAPNLVFGANGDVADFASGSLFGISDADLEELSGQAIGDAAVLEFDFTPTGDSLKFRYVFGSEEYTSFTCDNFNDAFGFFLSGPGFAGPFTGGAVNLAVVPGTSVPVAINTINGGEPTGGGTAATCAASDPNWQANSIYYVDNLSQTGTVVSYDGFTVVLTAFALVQCGVQYHIKLAIGDAFDTSYDSGVFLEGGSFTSTGQVLPELVTGPGVVGNTMNEGCIPVELTFTRQGDLSAAESVDIAVTGSATAGVDYSPALPATLDFAADDSLITFILDVPLDADGPEQIVITINQLIACANTNVETVFTFNIDSPPPLAFSASDINATCGDVNILDPQITGGVGFYAYQWSTGETTPTISVAPEVTTTYSFTVSDSCAVEPIIGSFTITLPVYPALDIEVTPALQIPCLGTDEISVVSATGGNGVYSYLWTQGTTVLGSTASVSVPSGMPTWYVVTVAEGCGAVVQDSVLVSMAPLDPIVITTTGDGTAICVGDTVPLGIVGITGGNGVYTREWTNSGGLLLATGNAIAVAVPVDATYTITVQDQCGMEGQATIRALVPRYEDFVIATVPDHIICLGDSSIAWVLVQGGSGYYTIDWLDLEWSDPILKVVPTEETTYVVEVTDRCGEVSTDQVTIDVEAIQIDITVTNRGQDDWYLQAATVPIGLTHVWDMGDGTMYRRDEVVHSYMDLEDHWASLRITTANGCAAIDSVLLEAPGHLYFPNAFTPDGDGLNDTFGPVGNAIEEFEMTIFNRWGEAIFATTNVGVPWLGDVNGSDAATTGVYVYKYRATGNYFPAVEGYGHVTLIKGTQD